MVVFRHYHGPWPKSKERLISNGENVPLICQSGPVSYINNIEQAQWLQYSKGFFMLDFFLEFGNCYMVEFECVVFEIVVCELAWILGLLSS